MAGLQTEVLTYTESVAAAAEEIVVEDSVTALEHRRIYGCSIVSDITAISALAIAARDHARLEAEVSFNGVRQKAGSILTLKNVICAVLQGAITPNQSSYQSNAQLYAEFGQPFNWPEGTTLNLIIYKVNTYGDALAMNCTATIYYKNA